MIEKKLESLENISNSIYLDSLNMFNKDPKAIEDYIKTDEISNEDKIEDINEMILFAEARELYEYCIMLKKMRDRING